VTANQTISMPQRPGHQDEPLTVFEQLRRSILTCELPPGAAIYEQELAQQFGVSKSPIREALLRLQEQKLVEVRARSGYRIKPVSITDANEIYEMRQMYERACVVRAIEKATDRQIDDLETHLTGNVHVSVSEWMAMNRHFHSAIANICGNALLAEAAMQLNDQVDRFTFVSLGRLPQPGNFDHLDKQHRRIVDAMKARDKTAALSVLRSHIEKSRLRTLQALTNGKIGP
jgi:GntR family transcriptional regulator, rspAB operon transcriptional repressor